MGDTAEDVPGGQVRILEKVFGILNHAGRNPRALQHRDHLFGRVLDCPFANARVKLSRLLFPRRKSGKAFGPGRVTHHPA
ncbi:MAG: hypothetical protein A2Z31_05270 [candidate division NC10 bacterium RBG_16_65_8]|nr:MAG: hypothetical protein A2Z31_05270 [candidate division NC10 bacterium RBG_16_65_8]